jgi:hypothetical protein
MIRLKIQKIKWLIYKDKWKMEWNDLRLNNIIRIYNNQEKR